MNLSQPIFMHQAPHREETFPSEGAPNLPGSSSDLCAKAEYARDWGQFCTSGQIRTLLEQLITDDDLATELAALSYRHENGFLKLLICRNLEVGYHIRLHLWPNGESDEQNVHDHRFDFWSYVLSGKLANHIWKASTAGQSFTRYVYEPRGSRTEYQMRMLGREQLQEDAVYFVEKQKSYYFDNSWLHTISCEPMTATLLLEDRRHLRSNANVFSKSSSDETVSIPSPSLNLSEYRALVRHTLGCLPKITEHGAKQH